MSAHEHPVPRASQAEQQWRQLDPARRRALFRGDDPVSREEARTSLGFALGMRERTTLWSTVGAVAAFVIVLALELVREAGVDSDSFILAGAIAVGVGLGLAFSGRRRARTLEGRARELLEASDQA